MKTLLLYGSPHKDRDTAALAAELIKYLHGDVTEISAYGDTLSPCVDCRRCRESKGCVIRDDLQPLFDDDYDAVVVASPVHMSGLPGPMVSLAGRFQAFYSAEKFLKDPIVMKNKTGVCILAGGGDGRPDAALRLVKMMFRYLHAEFKEENCVFSLRTDVLPAREDADALRHIREIAKRLNEGNP